MNEPFAKVVCICGRLVLLVNGIAVAMQGDPCRDPDVPAYRGPNSSVYVWEKEALEWTAAKINEPQR